MTDIVITEFMDERAVASLRERFEVRHDPALSERPDELLRLVEGALALIVRNRTRVDAVLLAGGSRLRAVGRLGVGLDNIDLAACAARDIKVIPAVGANAQAVAEYVITTALMLLRGAYACTGEVAAGRWPRAAASQGRELSGKVLGLVGFGSTSRFTGRLGRALGMRVIAHDPLLALQDPVWIEESTTSCPLEALLQNADVVSLHVPLTDATRNLFDAERLACMKSDAVLINAARGHVVDEAALVARLRAGKLGGAALDVYADEPLPAGSLLAGVPNLILTPHIAGVTQESNERVSRYIADKISEILAPRAHDHRHADNQTG
jgi:(S)-sulfolactate dehydrogenase